MLKTFIFDGNMLKNMNTLVQVEYPFCWLATPKENTNITMKKGAKKEPSGEWGVPFCVCFLQWQIFTGLYKLSISLEFACISEKKIRWQHQKEFNFVH
jgi:hypothetical protein